MYVHFSLALMLLAISALREVRSLAFHMDVGSGTRRSFFTESSYGALGFIASSTFSVPQAAVSAPEIFNTPSGIKYAILRDTNSKTASPVNGDFVAIEYTGYLTNGQIWDSTHAEGKGNALLFKLGTNVVVDGVNEMISNMSVGQKVQAIIPAKLAFGEKGLCLDGGECLIKPGATLVYDISLKKTAIPPP